MNMTQKDENVDTDTMMNLCFLDPPRWGWAALGGVTDTCPPIERSRRSRSQTEYLDSRQNILADLKECSTDESTMICAQKNTNTVVMDSGRIQCFKESKDNTPKRRATQGSFVKPDLPVENLHYINKEVKARKHSKGKMGENERIIEVNAFNNDGKLDMFVYHRGIVGKEPRDKETGELLCITDPVDTNHNWDEPDLKIKIKISFPLADLEDTSDGNDMQNFFSGKHNDQNMDASSFESDSNSGTKVCSRRTNTRISKKSELPLSLSVIESQIRRERLIAELPKFYDEIEWDLMNPLTPTPMIYASDIGAEFGLSFNQTLDLAESIQNQIDKHLRKSMQYQMPITIMDYMGVSRESTNLRPPDFAYTKKLHEGYEVENMNQTINESISQSKTEKDQWATKDKKYPKTQPVDPVSTKKKAGPCITKNLQKHEIENFDIEPEFVEEVLKRAKMEHITELQEKGKEIGTSFERFAVCHICKLKKPECCHFPCGFCHDYCNVHCTTRLGFTVSEVKRGLKVEYCPICCLECTCAKCTRTLKSVAHIFKQECLNQNENFKEITLNVLPLYRKDLSSQSNKPEIWASKTKIEKVPSSLFCKEITTTKINRQEISPSKINRQTTLPSSICYGETSQSKVSRQEISSSTTNRQRIPQSKTIKQLLTKITKTARRTMKRKAKNKISYQSDESNEYRTSTKRKMKNSMLCQSDGSSEYEEIKESTTSTTRKQRQITSEQGTENDSLVKVDKIPATEFPLEMMNGFNSDPAQKDDYCTVFTAKGKQLDVTKQIIIEFNNRKIQEKIDSDKETYQEDGNVDFCQVCKKNGGLICCDKCPRSFHDHCLTVENNKLPDYWECPQCGKDSTVQSGDRVKGIISLETMTSSFKDLENCEDFEEKVLVVSKIHEMIGILLDSDFGHVFEYPVDVDSLMNYREMVERPMDLGTIENGMNDGSYSKKAAESVKINNNTNGTAIDFAILAILNDIETVWHNCQLYNRDGSSVYRMATVLRKQTSKIRRCSFESQLNDFVRQRLGLFSDSCKTKRNDMTRTMVANSWLPLSIHEINIPFTQRKKIVAVFDPISQMVVKLYTKVSSAIEAAIFLSKSNKSERVVSTRKFFKSLFSKMNENPSLYLFGYRWLDFKDLKEGNFVGTNINESQGKNSPICDNDASIFVPNVVTEKSAVSQSDASKNITIECDTSKCDIQKSAAVKNDHSNQPHQKIFPLSFKVQPEPLVPDGDYFKDDKLQTLLDEKIVIAKRDTTSGANLGGFESEASAFEDWLQTRKKHLSTALQNVDSTITVFLELYLHGGNNLNGIVWEKYLPGNVIENNKMIEDEHLSKPFTGIKEMFDVAHSRTISGSILNNGLINKASPLKEKCYVSKSSLIPINESSLMQQSNCNRSTTFGNKCSPVKKSKVLTDSVELGPVVYTALEAAKLIPPYVVVDNSKIIVIDMVTLCVQMRFDTLSSAINYANMNSEDVILFSEKVESRSLIDNYLYAHACEEHDLIINMKEAVKTLSKNY